MSGEILMHVDDLKVYFNVTPQGAMPWTKPHRLKAVDGVSFDFRCADPLSGD